MYFCDLRMIIFFFELFNEIIYKFTEKIVFSANFYQKFISVCILKLIISNSDIYVKKLAWLLKKICLRKVSKPNVVYKVKKYDQNPDIYIKTRKIIPQRLNIKIWRGGGSRRGRIITLLFLYLHLPCVTSVHKRNVIANLQGS